MKNFILLVLITGISATAAIGQAATKITTQEEAARSAIGVGSMMPGFTLRDSLGNTVKSKDLLAKGNLVLVFYRGAWCPFCNTYLRTLQKNLSKIRENGGELVAISAENADLGMALAKKNDLSFTVLSDPDLGTARKFGIVYQLPGETDERYKSRGLDVAKNNGTDKPELPISATYVVNSMGEIVFAHIDADYKKRAEPDAIIGALAKIGK
ncbi:MAG: peroxiredoxin-like family protein [Pyrinomonadaceae bacterium]